MKNFHTCHQKSRSDGDGLRGFTIECFVADIRKSEENVRLVNIAKPNIAHVYLSLSEYFVLGCRL